MTTTSHTPFFIAMEVSDPHARALLELALSPSRAVPKLGEPNNLTVIAGVEIVSAETVTAAVGRLRCQPVFAERFRRAAGWHPGRRGRRSVRRATAAVRASPTAARWRRPSRPLPPGVRAVATGADTVG